jgi:hypothetical protein
VLPIPTDPGACALPILGHRYGRTDGQMDRQDGRTDVRTYVCGSGRALGLSKDPHYVDPGRLVCCEQQSKIVATDL